MKNRSPGIHSTFYNYFYRNHNPLISDFYWKNTFRAGIYDLILRVKYSKLYRVIGKACTNRTISGLVIDILFLPMAFLQLLTNLRYFRGAL